MRRVTVTLRMYVLTLVVCAIGLAALAFGVRYQATINMTVSLPFHVAIVEKGNLSLTRGDLVAFRWTGHDPIPVGLELIKRVVGVAGDRVRIDPVQNTNFPPDWLGELVVTSPDGGELARVRVKAFSRTGEPLQTGPVGTIPDQRYLVLGDHKDSLDSRYVEPGWIRADQLVGKVVWSW